MLYDLRRTFGTRQATELKTDPFTLAAMMGHSNLRTIMRYVHPDQTAQKDDGTLCHRSATAEAQGGQVRVGLSGGLHGFVRPVRVKTY